MDTAVPGAFEIASRRVFAAQFVFIAGDPEHRDRLRAFTKGQLADEQVPAVMADLDRLAEELIRVR